MSIADEALRAAKLEKLRLLQASIKHKEELPHIHGFPWYEWAWDFYSSTNKVCLLTAANQISKSSTQIRKCIDWATDQTKWPKLWRTPPRQFWYLYPTKDVATIEFHTKWVPEFMPRGDMVNDPVYGWRVEYTMGKKIHAVYFNSGVHVYFKTYSMDVSHLQTGTAHAIFSDEELPMNLYDELKFRLAATEGYFNMVFTATLAQEFWREAMELKGKEGERFPNAWKRQISMYDCLKYMDGTDSPWTYERIKEIEDSCQNEQEKQRRVWGRFVKSDNMLFPHYDPVVNRKTSGPIPEGWFVYSGIDLGGGATSKYAHPSAILFVGISPDYTKARIFRAWRGDGIKTTAGDVFVRYQMLKVGLNVVMQTFDYASTDFGMIAERNGEFFYKSEKNIDMGNQIINTLFKYGILSLDSGDPELDKLSRELESASSDGAVKHGDKDDLRACLRYIVLKIPFDWSKINPAAEKLEKEKELRKKTLEEKQMDVNHQRRSVYIKEAVEEVSNDYVVEEEMRFWQDQLE